MATADTTTTLAVNAAFLQEIKEVNQQLWELVAELRGLCSDPLAIRARSWDAHEMLNQLRDQLALHFALEEAYGYFEGAVSVEPRLSHRAAELRSQHRTLYRFAADIAEQAETLRRHGAPLDGVCRLIHNFQMFDQDFQDHEAWENELIQAEFDDDIGVGD